MAATEDSTGTPSIFASKPASPLYWEALADEGQDSFEARDMAAEHISRILESRPPFCYAVTGPWGSGKSTFLKFMLDDLRSRRSRGEGLLVVPFNAWKHSFGRDIAFTMFRDIHHQIRKDLSVIDSSLTIQAHLWSLTHALVLALEETGGAASWRFVRKFLLSALTWYLGENAEASATGIGQLRRAFLRLIQTLSKRGLKLIVVVDEIDRCSPEVAVRVLEAIRLFFFFDHWTDSEQTRSRDHNLVFILALDDDYVARAYAHEYGLSRLGAYRYLHKFFQFLYQMSSPNYSQFMERFFADHGSTLPSSLDRASVIRIVNSLGVRSTREVRLILVHFIDWMTRWFSAAHNSRIRALLDSEQQAGELEKIYYLLILQMCILKILFPRIYVESVRSRLIAELPRRQASSEIDLDGLKEYADGQEEELELTRTIGLLGDEIKQRLKGLPDRKRALAIIGELMDMTLDY